MKTCGTCNHHKNGVNDPQSREMAKLGWKLCAKSDDQIKNARYFHVNFPACVKYNKSIA